MALPNDRQFREKYRGKNPIFLQGSILPQQQYLFKRKKIGHEFKEIILLEKISIYHGSIVDDDLIIDVDAVILPANERLWADGSGAGGAIFAAAGCDKLQKACTAITHKTDDHSIPNGQTVITKGFDLNVDYILHTIAPSVQDNEVLVSCYISALELCVQTGIRSVAFPCIGTGDGNFSKQAACSIALRAVRGWLADANNVKYQDFMAKSKKKQWHKNVEEKKDDDDEQEEEDIFKIVDLDETVCDRILNIVFCCFDEENWDLYTELMPKIYPCSDDKHSYLWIDKIRSIEYKCMLHHIQSLEQENKQLKSGAEDNESKQSEQDLIENDLQNSQPRRHRANDLQKIYIDVMKQKEKFNIAYTKDKIIENIKISPKSLIETNKETLNTLNYLHKIKEATDSFMECVEDMNSFISLVSTPNTNKYEQWNVNDIIIWILSLENGRFTNYINQIKDGLIASEINDGDTLTELTRSDLSVPPFNINSFKVKKDLIQHFQSLKTGIRNVDDKNSEGDNSDNTENTYTVSKS